MTKLRLQISVLVFLFSCLHGLAQDNYRLHIKGADKDSAELVSSLGIKTQFSSRFECMEYIGSLPSLLQSKGYITASVDSIRQDSQYTRIVLFAGVAYKWALLDAKAIDPEILSAVGWREKVFNNRPIDFTEVQFWEEKILSYLESNGRPFARVYLDSLQLQDDKVSALLKIQNGPLYKIDSIRVYGNVRITNNYLQRYLEIPNGSVYNREKLLRISKKIRELPWIEEEKTSNLTKLGTGSVLNLYLRRKKSSQVNILIGFLPNNDQLSSKKLLLTGEANILLRNELGSGETIGLNWQKLQVNSPRLNVIYQQPYLFGSPFGLDFAFDFFHKDTTFLNVNIQLGAQYSLNTNQAGKVFIQRFQTIVNGINKASVIQNKRLPDEADVSLFNVGVDYEFNNTNYRLNPTHGNEFRIITTIGSKTINKNNEVLSLKDPGDPSYDFDVLYDTVKLKTYQLRVRVSGAHYFPLSQAHALKMAFNGGFLQSGNIFRNELFQIGGYKLLRGFDEESQYLSQFAIGTVEYHFLVGVNSYFYALVDGGWGRNSSQNNKANYTYFGTGAGLAYQNKIGIFNIAWAVGKRNDTEFNLRQSKIHFGFVNYF